MHDSYPRPLYNVALWRYWSASELPFVEDVEASSPLLAALSLMQHYKLTYVARAAVALPNGTIIRWSSGLNLETSILPDDSDENESEED